MSWMLQPRNWTQARGRNLYNVAYRRSGTYKGMGQSGTSIYDVNMTSFLASDGTPVGPGDNPAYGVDSQGNVWNYATGQMLGSGPTAGNTNIQRTFQSGGTTYGVDTVGQVFNMITGALAAPAAPGVRPPAQPNWTPYLILGGGILLVMLIARR